ncbi:MAG TPA: class I SAM-dependent methyltransferase [Xanthobacteraceae bacterium]|jgi:SAM-dependent methyltransferase
MTFFEGAWLFIGQQLRKPAGFGGDLLARALGLINERSNRIAIAALDITLNDTVLELGFGTGRAIRVIATAAAEGRVFGIDHSPTMCFRASRRLRHAIPDGRVRLVHGSLRKLPWPESAVDKCLAVHVAYFMDEKQVREARRVLRIGGRLAVLVTDKAAMGRWKFAHPGTHRLFAASDLTKLLLDGGFSREEMCLQNVSLGMAIPGLLALAIKSAP